MKSKDDKNEDGSDQERKLFALSRHFRWPKSVIWSPSMLFSFVPPSNHSFFAFNFYSTCSVRWTCVTLKSRKTPPLNFLPAQTETESRAKHTHTHEIRPNVVANGVDHSEENNHEYQRKWMWPPHHHNFLLFFLFYRWNLRYLSSLRLKASPPSNWSASALVSLVSFSFFSRGRAAVTCIGFVWVGYLVECNRRGGQVSWFMWIDLFVIFFLSLGFIFVSLFVCHLLIQSDYTVVSHMFSLALRL